MMSLVLWEMWNENLGEIDEKVWVNQKTNKSKMKLGFVTSMINLYLIGVTCMLFLLLRTPRQERWRVTNCRDQFVPNWSCAISMIVESSYEFGFVLSQLLWESELRANIFCFVAIFLFFIFFVGFFQGLKILSYFIKDCGLKM